MQNQFIKQQHCWCESVDRCSAEGVKHLGPILLTEPQSLQDEQDIDNFLSLYASCKVEQWASFQMQLQAQFISSELHASA